MLSTFGHMFAPNHRQAAQELVRVCKPGGTIGFTTWTMIGYSGQLFRTIGAHAPPPPEGVGVPPQWADRDHVHEMLAPLEPEFAEDDVLYESDTSDGLADFFIENFGPLVTLRAASRPTGGRLSTPICARWWQTRTRQPTAACAPPRGT